MQNTIDRKELPKLAIFGAGGLGIEMIALLSKRQCFNLVGILDKTGYAFDNEGLDLNTLYNTLNAEKAVSALNGSTSTETAIQDFMNSHAGEIDAIFYALPNLPNTFIPDITKYIANETEFKGVITDALKRTSAVDLLTELNQDLERAGILYMTGCGATPGMLTTAAAVAAQSFVEVESVEITFGVGIANWQAYRATIREDIAHMPGYDVNKASQMTEEEIDKLLEETNGLLHLENMEHADDIMLEMANICPAERVTVGGIVDTRNAKKPLSTNVKITGVTYQGKRSIHQFILGDETTMAANVNGNVLGFMNAGIALQSAYNASGLKTAAEVLPRFAPVRVRAAVSA